MNRDIGLVVVVLGVGAVIVGALIWAGALSWFGRLPGDVRLRSGGTRVVVPIVSSIVASVVLTIVVNVVLRLLR